MKLHNKIAHLFGYELVRLKQQAKLDNHLQKVITHYGINTILDVGANTGQYGKYLRKLGYRGEILSFEPIKSSYEELRKKADNDSRWLAFHKALGRQTGKQTLNVMQGSTFSSFRSPSDFGKKKFSQQLNISHTEDIDISTVDVFLTQEITKLDQRKILLKMDTQGFDLEVFAGALKSLDNILAIQTEIAFTPIYENMPTHLETLQALHRQNYTLSGLYPISRNHSSLGLIEGDCVFIKEQPCQK